MVESVMLKWTRKYKGLTQQQVADAVGLSNQMISKLELDHKHWKSLSVETKTKFNEFFEGCKGWEPLNLESAETEESKKTENVIEEIHKNEKPIKRETKIEKKDNKLTENDDKVLTLIEFAYEGLSESKTHNEFISNINLMKRILKKYEF